jgi:hypothetical protein
LLSNIYGDDAESQTSGSEAWSSNAVSSSVCSMTRPPGLGRLIDFRSRRSKVATEYFWDSTTQRVMAGITRTSADTHRLDRLSTTMCTVECWGRCSTSSGPAEVRLIATKPSDGLMARQPQKEARTRWSEMAADE